MKKIGYAIKDETRFPILIDDTMCKVTFPNGFPKVVGECMNDIEAWAHWAGYQIELSK